METPGTTTVIVGPLEESFVTLHRQAMESIFLQWIYYVYSCCVRPMHILLTVSDVGGWLADNATPAWCPVCTQTQPNSVLGARVNPQPRTAVYSLGVILGLIHYPGALCHYQITSHGEFSQHLISSICWMTLQRVNKIFQCHDVHPEFPGILYIVGTRFTSQD